MSKVKVTKGEMSKDGLRGVVVAPLGSGMSMPSRYFVEIDTGVEVKTQEGYTLVFALVSELAKRGLIATNAGRIDDGKIVVSLLNANREIIVVTAGDPLINVWVEKEYLL